jgi:endogenous inhibitor of DNA gyrase (YacG/DUF329 family)
VTRGAPMTDRDDAETVPCPHCGAAVYEEAERCPHCETYLSEEDAPAHKPWWVVVGALAALAVVALWIWKG